jgi:hypothetical protein
MGGKSFSQILHSVFLIRFLVLESMTTVYNNVISEVEKERPVLMTTY